MDEPRHIVGNSLTQVLRRGSERSACSLDVKPILSKRADCRSAADEGVRAVGGGTVEGTNLSSAVPAADAKPVPMHSRSIGGADIDDHGVRAAQFEAPAECRFSCGSAL